MTDDERIDLSELDPTADAERFERIVGVIAERAAPELRRRQESYEGFGGVMRWSRPVLAAAAVIILVSVTALARKDSGLANAAEYGIAEAVGIPTALAELASLEAPSPEDLLAALGRSP